MRLRDIFKRKAPPAPTASTLIPAAVVAGALRKAGHTAWADHVVRVAENARQRGRTRAVLTLEP